MFTGESILFHFTDREGYNGIRAEVDWRFRASQPPPHDHPQAAYFTDYPPHTANLALRLRIPKVKVEFVFAFVNENDLAPLRGARGEHIFYSEADYIVKRSRQRYCGLGDKYTAEARPT